MIARSFMHIGLKPLGQGGLARIPLATGHLSIGGGQLASPANLAVSLCCHAGHEAKLGRSPHHFPGDQ